MQGTNAKAQSIQQFLYWCAFYRVSHPHACMLVASFAYCIHTWAPAAALHEKVRAGDHVNHVIDRTSAELGEINATGQEALHHRSFS